jgi:hypothetical protein
MRKLTLDEIQRDAARYGGRCLSTHYVDSLTRLEWECGAGHRWLAVAHAIRQGHWCKRCADARLRHPLHEVQEVALFRGGKLVSERYGNSQQKLEWECAHGHRWQASFNSVKQGSWCPQCRAESRASRQASGSDAAQSKAIAQKPAAPARAYSAPETSVTSAVAPPMPTVP